MANPKADINFDRFRAFVDERIKAADWEDYVSRDGTDLNKQAIARDCEFDRKRITGNSKILGLYNEVKADLIAKGLILDDKRPVAQKVTESAVSSSSARDRAALKKAQEKAAAADEELFQVKQQLKRTEDKLKRLETIEKYMLETGRL